MPSSAVQAALRVAHDVDLQPFNTFGLPARAEHCAVVDSPEQVAHLARGPEWGAGPRLILGGGSNIVFAQDVPGLVLRVAIRGRSLVREDDGAWYVRAGAGESWDELVRWTVAQGWPGLENLALIPGTVGAAPIQNIGAYGLELAERFDRLEAISLGDFTRREFDCEACRFGYRDSVFKHGEAGRWLITAVTLRLPKRWQALTRYAELARELEQRAQHAATPAQVMDAVIAIRQRKLPDPARIGNVGSFFKNPLVDPDTLARLLERYPELPHYLQRDGTCKLAAAWLIDQLGWKGRDLGPVGCFEQQALVLVNRGGARGTDVRRIATAIQDDVAAHYGIRLEPEPTFV